MTRELTAEEKRQETVFFAGRILRRRLLLEDNADPNRVIDQLIAEIKNEASLRKHLPERKKSDSPVAAFVWEVACHQKLFLGCGVQPPDYATLVDRLAVFFLARLMNFPEQEDPALWYDRLPALSGQREEKSADID